MENTIKILQASIAPSVLISGFGLLLLTMTNRLARPIDRIRSLTNEIKQAPQEEGPALQQQVSILYQRCHFLRMAIAFITTSIFLVSIMILVLFSSFTFGLNLAGGVQSLFVGSLISLIASLVFFILDVRVTLRSIKIEIDKYSH